MNKLLTPFQKDTFRLKNHLVMAPMTRSRAIDNIPNELMQEYYGQRVGAGLIVTEGTSPMADGVGYPRIPGIYSEAQVKGWKQITDTVHEGGSKIFLQLMHCGRIAQEDNVPEGGHIFSPSAKRAEGKMFTDTKGLQDHSTPTAFTGDDIERTIVGHVKAAQNAIRAGFDGVELHGANGYLVEQFLNPNVNDRTDEYGGSVDNRLRFVEEVTRRMADAIGPENVGVRISPYGTFNDQPVYDREIVHETYVSLAEKLEEIGIQYIHLSMSPIAPKATYQAIRDRFSKIIIQCNGLQPDTALLALGGLADLVAFGRHWLANPDLDKRIESDAELTEADPSRFYTPNSRGYVDYKTLN